MAERSMPARSAPVITRLGRRLVAARSGEWNLDAVVMSGLTVVLVIVGLVMSFSASFVDAAQGGDPFGVFRRQALWAGTGLVAFVFFAALDHRLWRPMSWLVLLGSIAGLVAVLIPGVGLTEGGSTRWIALGPVVVQPSEVAKLALLLWLADVHARKRERGIDLDERLSHLLVPALPVLGLLVVLVLAEPDLGTSLLLALITGLILWYEGVPTPWVVGLATGGGALAVLAAVVEPYRFARISGWLHPESDPLGNGFQLLQSLYALGSGGWFGVGLGQSRGKWNFIPNPETDFIFAIIGEELGLIGACGVLLLFAGLLIVGLRIARHAPDRFAAVYAFGVIGWVVGQALVNVGAVTGLLPITGVTLPLVSVGGSSLLVTLVAFGILVAIARGSEEQPS